MRVLSPVGMFPLKVTGVSVRDRTPVVDAAMGAWRSEVRFDVRDLPLVAALGGITGAIFLLGRATARHKS